MGLDDLQQKCAHAYKDRTFFLKNGLDEWEFGECTYWVSNWGDNRLKAKTQGLDMGVVNVLVSKLASCRYEEY